MAAPTGPEVSLPPTWRSRLRVRGLPEVLSWFLLLTSGVQLVATVQPSPEGVDWPLGADLALLGVLLASGLAIRFLVLREYVVASSEGIRWRSLGRRASVPWEFVAELAIEPMYLLTPLRPWWRGVPVLAVRLVDGQLWKIRASANRAGQERFVREAAVLWHGARPGRSMPGR